MPRARDAKVWNEDLVRALEAKRCEAVQNRSRQEFMWQSALRDVEACRKEIYVTSTNKIVNLPKFAQKTVREFLEAVMRGESPLCLLAPRTST